MKSFLVVVLIISTVVKSVEPHGHLQVPLARTAQHLAPGEPYRPPYYYDHQGVWCENIPQDERISNCGRCGGPVGDNDFNRGGAYDKGVIQATYTAGQIIVVDADFGAGHRGYFEVDLCSADQETDDCFQNLTIVSASQEIRSGNRVCVPYSGSGTVSARVQLPAGVRCENCTLRWTYRTSYPPESDYCFNPNPAQTFRNCANVRIY